VISAVATLLQAGIVKRDGAFNLDSRHPALREHGHGGRPEAVIVPALKSESGRDIVLTQDDVRAMQLGKAALRAGIEILMKDQGIDQVDQVFLAGTFGNYIDPVDAVDIGMLPPVEPRIVKSAGNAAGDGARLALFNKSMRKSAAQLARRIRVLELSMRPDFQEVFVDSMGF
jgi:uncharacterized 2Fe-2S/4Fe-4S cluster protein (DUF4445 family)